VEAKV
jgi:hypothetical protein